MSAERAAALQRWAEANGYGREPSTGVEAEPAPTVLDIPATWRVDEGECIALMRELPAESVDAIVTDPPYGLGFMGKAWDALPPGVEWAEECLRVLKPGGHLLAFGGTRTYHRLACAIEDAGFDIRDTLAWMYGSGFPKSRDVSKAIDKQAGAEREVVDEGRAGASAINSVSRVEQGYRPTVYDPTTYDITAPATDDALRWQGWGTALKPAHEPVVVARKPLTGTVADNVLEHGTGALNVGGCRIGTEGGGTRCSNRDAEGRCLGHRNAGRSTSGETFHGPESSGAEGRWPANVVLDEEAARLLDVQADGASRFFYCAKASRRERDAGLEGKNTHPTVKPVALMRYLVRLVTPPGGLVLDPFAGSGTTGIAAVAEGFRFLGIELDPEYAATARARIEHAKDDE